MTRENILEEIIVGYRNTIYLRYQYDTIKEKYEIPDSINEETFHLLRNYFLDYIYPPHERRTELNEAFKSLDTFIKHPQKLLSLLWDASKLIFKYGRGLPKILSTGFIAMQSFRAVEKFENIFVDHAVKNEIDPPYNIDKMNVLIKELPPAQIEKFIETAQSLFETLHDSVLINKIKEVLQYVIYLMKKNKAWYSVSQVKGIELALEMLVEGDKLFQELSKEDQHNLVYLIIEIEKDTLEQIL